jgi:hypothetical protein
MIGVQEHASADSGRPVRSFAPMIGDPEHANPDARTDPDRTGLGDGDGVVA